MGNIAGRMQFCAEAVKRLSQRQGIRGQIVSADRGARYFSLSTRLANPLQLDAALKLADPLALATHTPVVIAQREAGLIAYQFQLPEGDWHDCTRLDLKSEPTIIGMGLSERRRQINYEFARPHGGFFAATQQGKTTALKTLIIGLIQAYTPQQLGIVIIDPESQLQQFSNVIHLAGLPVASSDEEIDGVLTYSDSVFQRRIALHDENSARLVIVIDEAEAIIKYHQRRHDIISSIAKRGAKRQVNLVLAAQNPTSETLPDLLPNLGNRWVGLVDSGRTSAHLTGQAGLACHKLTGRGDFMHVTGSQAQRLQVAMPTDADYAALPRAEIAPPEFEPVEVDAERWENEGAGRGRRPDPFDWRLVGRVLAHLAKSPALADGTLANRLGVGVRKLARHRGIASEVLSGLREELEAMS